VDKLPLFFELDGGQLVPTLYSLALLSHHNESLIHHLGQKVGKFLVTRLLQVNLIRRLSDHIESVEVTSQQRQGQLFSIVLQGG